MYTFVLEKDITFKYELAELEPEKIYEHFMEYEDEVCFILDKGLVYGIVTIGDMWRYYVNESENLNITTQYRFISEVDFAKAEVIFNEIPTVHEVPVIVDNFLMGIVRKYPGMDRTWLRQQMAREREGANVWKRKEYERVVSKLRGKVYLYDICTSEITKKLNIADDCEWKAKQKYMDGMSGLKMLTEAQRRCFFGSDFSEENLNEFCKDFNSIRMTVHNGIDRYQDMCSKYFNYKDGHRVVANADSSAPGKIWMFGPCTVVGAYVEDRHTIEYYLQEILRVNGWDNYCVINCGGFGPGGICGRLATEQIAEEDIVIIADNFEELYMMSENREVIKSTTYCGSFAEAYLGTENLIDNLYNAYSHCNYVMNQKIAEKVYRDIRQSLTKDKSPVSPRIAIQDYYIPWDVVKYYREYKKSYQLIEHRGGICGAIVMNCNPFTKGHRYLIEQAALQVDCLYIFVVEEDKSVFKFEDRIEMVQRGTADLKNVKVLPSGKYIISKETFSQYFEKDNVEQVDDMDYDVRIFGEVVAKELGISIRFVGEEPFDKVTKKYNETMKKILPEYDIKVVEIPRTTTVDGSIISASAVRKAMREKDERLLHAMLPDTTSAYLNYNKIKFNYE